MYLRSAEMHTDIGINFELGLQILLMLQYERSFDPPLTIKIAKINNKR